MSRTHYVGQNWQRQEGRARCGALDIEISEDIRQVNCGRCLRIMQQGSSLSEVITRAGLVRGSGPTDTPAPVEPRHREIADGFVEEYEDVFGEEPDDWLIYKVEEIAAQGEQEGRRLERARIEAGLALALGHEPDDIGTLILAVISLAEGEIPEGPDHDE